MPETGTLTVARVMAEDVGQRHVDLFVNGNRVGSLKAGETLTRPIAVGHHTLKAHNTLVGKTEEFDVAPGEHVRFETANVAGFGTWLVFVLGAGPVYVALRRVG